MTGGEGAEREVPAALKVEDVGVARHGGDHDLRAVLAGLARDHEILQIAQDEFITVVELAPGIGRDIHILTVGLRGAEVVNAGLEEDDGMGREGVQEIVDVVYRDLVGVLSAVGGGDRLRSFRRGQCRRGEGLAVLDHARTDGGAAGGEQQHGGQRQAQGGAASCSVCHDLI